MWSAGVLNRNGTNADFVAIDERIVGHAPKNLSWADAAAIPLALVRCLAAPYLTTLPPPHPGAPSPNPCAPCPNPCESFVCVFALLVDSTPGCLPFDPPPSPAPAASTLCPS